MQTADQSQGSGNRILVDADACPVKDEIYRVAERHALPVLLVANSYMRFPRGGLVTLEVVSDGFDAADDRIAQLAGPNSIVITTDILLAERCVDVNASVLTPKGHAFTSQNIGQAVTSRAIATELRSAAVQKNDGRTGRPPRGPEAMTPKDRSKFLQALHEACVRLKA